MERLNVFDCSNVLIASFFTDDRSCAHENREHTLIYHAAGQPDVVAESLVDRADSRNDETVAFG